MLRFNPFTGTFDVIDFAADTLHVLRAGDTMTGALTTTAVTISSGSLVLPTPDITGATSNGWISSGGKVALAISGNNVLLNTISNAGGTFDFIKGGDSSQLIARLTNSGELGIGAAPTSGVQLDIYHASNPAIGINKTGATAQTFLIQAQGNALNINRSGSATRGITILANTDGTLAGVGIATVTPAYILDVAGTMGVSGVLTATAVNQAIIIASASPAGQALVLKETSGGHFNWLMGQQYTFNNVLEFTPSTATNGVAFSNPVFSLVAVASSGNGLRVTPTAAGSGVKLGVTSTTTPESLSIDSVGSTSYLNLQNNSGGSVRINSGSTNNAMLIVGSSLSVAAEKPYYYTNSGTHTITAGFSKQRFNFFDQQIVSAASALTVTTATNVYVAGAPIVASSALITTAIALRVSADVSLTAGVTTSYGLYVDTQVGAGTNYNAAFMGGNVGIGTATPSALLDVIRSGSGTLSRFNDGSRTVVILTDSTQGYIGTTSNHPFAIFTNNGNAHLIVDTTGNIQLTHLITQYNSVTTTGLGVHAVYGAGRSTGQTGAVTSVATYTCGAADGTFYISANVNVTTFIAGTITVSCDYTDETNTARTLNFTFSNLTGTLGTAIGASGVFEGLTIHIRAKASTAIKIYTTVSLANFTYNVEGYISQIG